MSRQGSSTRSGGAPHEHEVFTNLLVLDEVVHVSRRHGVEEKETLEFVDRAILPHVELLPIGTDLYQLFKLYVVDFGLRPPTPCTRPRLGGTGSTRSSEDKDFNRARIKRIWL